MRVFLKIFGAVVVLYVLAVGTLLALAAWSPQSLAKVIARIPSSESPGPMFMIIPLKPVMLLARSGRLRVGDSAPDFRLNTPDSSQTIQLSDFRGKTPVVLVFGSYT
ncbi:MAG: redoxin domain-containing protein [Acidobacteriota bacterium]|nr:redoxin domain-containing protein [Acidobacteriota bacterium]